MDIYKIVKSKAGHRRVIINIHIKDKKQDIYKITIKVSHNIINDCIIMVINKIIIHISNILTDFIIRDRIVFY